MDFFKFLWGRPVYILDIYLAIITLATFIVFGIDKLKARRGRRRISEAALMTLCAFGGSLGGLAGMYVFRHKTLHRKFTAGVPLILLFQVVLAVLIAVLAGR
ncbi:MAG: DUF1294 domain-containing protein [Clostridiales bacterium]|jgi:uncharacterized membrane protein YsdA (DUF1294 family)|nr:DUF1294 domain-containing protein [Clostridiales bacterium]